MVVWRGQRVADFGMALITRRFPPPWAVERSDASSLGTTAGQALAYVHFEEEPGRRASAKLLTRDDPWRIAVDIAKLPELLAVRRS